MNEQSWDASTSPRDLLEALRAGGSARKLRLYAVACCRLLGALLHKPAYRTAVDVAEAFADGGAAEAMLAVAQEECMSAGPEHGFVNSQVQWAAWKVVWHTGNEWTQDPPALIAAIDSTSAVLNVLYRGAHTASPDAVRTSVIAVTAAQTALVRCAFGNPFRPVEFDPAWRTSDAVALAQSMYNSRDFTAMPILADALQDAGCENEEVLTHCRAPGPHARGCWVVDGVLGKA